MSRIGADLPEDQHGLNPMKVTLRHSSQGDVTVVDLGCDERRN